MALGYMGTKTRRFGRFRVGWRFFHGLHAGEGYGLFDRMVVVRAEQRMDCDVVEYLAIHPDFDAVQEAEEVPLYEPHFDRVSAAPTWRRAAP